MKCSNCDVQACIKRTEAYHLWSKHEFDWDKKVMYIPRPTFALNCNCTICVIEIDRCDKIVKCQQDIDKKKNIVNGEYGFELEFYYYYNSNPKRIIEKTETVHGVDSYEVEQKIIKKYPNVTFKSIERSKANGSR